MKISASKDKLLEGLKMVQNVVGNRAALPILANVLLRASDGRLYLTTTDLDVSVTGSVEVTVDKEGTTTLPVRRLSMIIAALPSAEVTIDVDGKHEATIRCEKAMFKIKGLDADEFPPAPTLNDAKVFHLKQHDIKEGLRRTSYAISNDETRYVLNGILFSFKENKLTMVATDGRRLAMVDIESEFPASNDCDVIVPTKCINELQRFVSDNGEVSLSMTENQAAFEGNGVRVVSKLVEGNYPNYRQVIPAESRERIPLERQQLLESVSRVALLSSDKSNSVKLLFSKNNLEITANTPDVGEARESLAVNYKGREVAIAFNPEYLMAPLKALNTDEVLLDLSDEMSPGVLRDQTPFLYVLMPMRIS